MNIRHKISLISSLIIFLSTSFICAYNNNDYEYIYGVNNLLLIGKNDKSKSYYNFFIVLTIDSVNKKLTLTSLNKDTVIDKNNNTLYEEYLNKDESYLINTIESDFNINIDNYVVIDSFALSKIVDSTGTIELYSKPACGNDILDFLKEKRYLNVYEQGKVQMDVIQELLYGFSRLPFSKYPYVIKETFSCVKINITPFKMLSLGFTALSLKNYTADKFQPIYCIP